MFFYIKQSSSSDYKRSVTCCHLSDKMISLLWEMHKIIYSTELEFLKSLWGLGTEEEEGCHTGPPGYIGWRNSFHGIDS